MDGQYFLLHSPVRNNTDLGLAYPNIFDRYTSCGLDVGNDTRCGIAYGFSPANMKQHSTPRLTALFSFIIFVAHELVPNLPLSSPSPKRGA